MKRKLWYGFVLLLLCGLLSIPAAAEETVAEGTFGTNISWSLDSNGKMTVSGTGTISDYNNVNYTWEQYLDQIQRAEICDGITNVPERAFSGCTALTEVILGDTVTTIGYGAFENCAALTQLNWSGELTLIDAWAFAQCTALTEAELPEKLVSIGGFAFSGCTGLTKVTVCDGLTEVRGYAFDGCSSLTELLLPDSVTSIGVRAFRDCTGLTQFRIPAGLTATGEYMMENCTGLTEIIIPDSVQTVAEGSFSGCTGVTRLQLGSGVTSIESMAFGSCAALSQVELPQGLTTIGSYAFSFCPLQEVTIPKSVKSIGTYAFYYSKIRQIIFEGNQPSISNATFENLYAMAYYPQGDDSWDISSLAGIRGRLEWIPYEAPWTDPGVVFSHRLSDTMTWTLHDNGLLEILGTGEMVDPGTYADGWPWEEFSDQILELYISEGVTNIASSAFSGCAAMTKATIPQTVTVLESNCFRSCKALERIDIPDSVLEIKSSAFSGCSQLKEVKLPSGLTRLEQYIFNSCKSLTEVNIPSTVTELGYGAFYECSSLERIELPDGIHTVEGWAFFCCSSLKEINFPKSLTYVGNRMFYNCSSLEEMVIPEWVTSIESCAFQGCKALKKLTIPQTVTSIGNAAFSSCESLTELELPPKLTAITGNMFSYCTGLTNLNIPDTVTEIGVQAFSYCGALRELELPPKLTTISTGMFSGCTNLTKVTIPDTVTTISTNVFSRCTSLKQITIPKNVTSLGNRAFEGCTGLTGITFKGDHPSFGVYTFRDVTATARYPVSGYWPSTQLRDFGGDITWVAYEDPTLSLSYPSLTFEDEVFYNIYFTVSDMAEVEQLGLLIFDEEITEGEIHDAAQVTVGYTFNGTHYGVRSNGIPAKDLSDTVYFKVYALLSDGTCVYSNMESYSALLYADTMLSDETVSPALKSLMVAMLNYSTAAQEFFGYRTDSLANAGVTEEQQALVEAFHEDMVSPVIPATPEKAAGFVYNGGYIRRYPSVTFGGAFSINYYFQPAYTPEDGLTLLYWDTAAYEAADQLTADNAAGTCPMTFIDGQWHGAVEGLAAKQIDETIYAAAVYTHEGTTYCTGVLAYSVAEYCLHNGSDLGIATAVYGYYAKQFFA